MVYIFTKLGIFQEYSKYLRLNMRVRLYINCVEVGGEGGEGGKGGKAVRRVVVC